MCTLQVGLIGETHYVSLHSRPETGDDERLGPCMEKIDQAANTDIISNTQPKHCNLIKSLENSYTAAGANLEQSITGISLPEASVNSGPHQPVLNHYPKSYCGTRMRNFRPAWYAEFCWLEYSQTDDAAYCYYCRLFADKAAQRKQTTVFVAGGFRNWRDAVCSFQRHEQSDQHKQSASFFLDAKKMLTAETSVASQLSTQHAADVEKNRRNLARIIEAVKLLGRQNIAFRGHDESAYSKNKGNFIELLTWKAEEIPELEKHLASKYHYISPISQNELIELIGSNIRSALLSTVLTNNVWSLIIDETSDIAHQEQLSLCFRTVTTKLYVEEHFFKFVMVPQTDAATLVSVIKEQLFDGGFPIETLYFQCYDGASNMKGQYSGVAARIRQIAPKAIYIHCHSHLLNLSLQNSCSSIPVIRNCLGQINALYNFLEASPKRHCLFAAKQQKMSGGQKCKTLKLLCETRWASREKAVSSVMENFEVIICALEELSDEPGKIGGEASALLKSCATFEFFFYISLLNEIFHITSTLSNYLQGVKISVGSAVKLAGSCCMVLQARRNDDYFNQLWLKAYDLATTLNLEQPTLPRKKRVPLRIDDGLSSGDHHATVQSLYRMNYYEALDTIVTQLANRFSENDLSPLLNIESLLLSKSVESELQQKVATVRGLYSCLSSSLSAELEVIKVMMTNHKCNAETVDEVAKFFTANSLHSILPEVCLWLVNI